MDVIDWISEHITTGRIASIADRTFASLTERVEPDGFLVESPSGKYGNATCFARSVGAMALMLHEMGMPEKAMFLLDGLFARVYEESLPDIPHVLFRRGRPSQMVDQIDATAHAVLAFARLSLDNSREDFFRRHYDFCRGKTVRFFRAPYFSDGNPPSGEMETDAILRDGTAPKEDAPCLIRNLHLEHSRNYVYWDCSDMLSQTFVGAAGEAMQQLALEKGDHELADWLSVRTAALRRGIDRNLTFVENGQRLYYEMRVTRRDDPFGEPFPALGWPLYAPMAIGWDGLDRNVYDHTIEVLHSRTQLRDPVSGARVNMEEYMPDGRIFPETCGKVVAWDIDWYRSTQNWEGVRQWILFLEANTVSEILPERYDPVRADGSALIHRGKLLYDGSLPEGWKWSGDDDAGNGEQCIWFCLSIYRLRKALGCPTKWKD